MSEEELHKKDDVATQMTPTLPHAGRPSRRHFSNNGRKVVEELLSKAETADLKELGVTDISDFSISCKVDCLERAKRTYRVSKQIFVCEDRAACLYSHNKIRGLHGVPSLRWDSKLAEDAKNWAIYLIEQNLTEHGANYPQGENLYCMPCDNNFHRVYQAVAMQYKEIDKYDFAAAKKYEESDCVEFGDVGHFSQNVWKDTKNVGSCVAFDRHSKRTVVVIRYWPGQGYDFTTQVNPPKCGQNAISSVENLKPPNDVTPTLKKEISYEF